MTCTELSDRMPDVAHGRSDWSEAEAAHLAGCAECRAEWQLVTTASRLGDGLPSPAEPSVALTLVLHRLVRERDLTCRRMRLWSAAGLAAAAAVLLAVWTGGLGRGSHRGVGRDTPTVAVLPVAPGERTRPVPGPAGDSTAPGDSGTSGAPALATASTGGRAELPLPELDDLPAEVLDSMLEVLDEPAARAEAYELPDLGDSGDIELERALTGLEG